MDVRFKKTPEGEVAILPRAEYERLVRLAEEAEEDAGTARIVARAKREVADGAPLLPKAVVDRLANGENPIRVLREFREQTQPELAARVGIGQGYLSDLETESERVPSNCIISSHGRLVSRLTCWRRLGLHLRRRNLGASQNADRSLRKLRGRVASGSIAPPVNTGLL